LLLLQNKLQAQLKCGALKQDDRLHSREDEPLVRKNTPEEMFWGVVHVETVVLV
jgi:hypothetical protein